MNVLLTRRHEISILSKSISDWNGAKKRKTDELFNLLIIYPAMGQIEKDDIRGFQLTPQTRILYRIKGQKIIILAFFDVRQNPKKKLS